MRTKLKTYMRIRLETSLALSWVSGEVAQPLATSGLREECSLSGGPGGGRALAFVRAGETTRSFCTRSAGG